MRLAIDIAPLRSGKNNAKWPLVCSNTASAVKTLELGDPLFTWRFRLSDHNGDHLAKEADLWSRWLLLLCIGIAACLQQEKEEDGLWNCCCYIVAAFL